MKKHPTSDEVERQSLVEWFNDYDSKPKSNRSETVKKPLRENHKSSPIDVSQVAQSETAIQANEPEETDCSIESEPLVPDGEYKVKYLEHHTINAKGTGKLVIWFTIVEGEYQGIILKCYFPVILKGPVGKFGEFKVNLQGKYYDQMSDLFPDLTERPNRVSPQRLKGKTVLVDVVTVGTNWKGDERKPVTKYSKVDRLIAIC